LLGDNAAGRADCVVAHQVDRFSRSLLDFAKRTETFERHPVAFVSVTLARCLPGLGQAVFTSWLGDSARG
jgi:DNA invertase Pin-like site-specific DNA recombinase